MDIAVKKFPIVYKKLTKVHRMNSALEDIDWAWQ